MGTREAQRGKCNERDLPCHVRCKNRIWRYLAESLIYLSSFNKVWYKRSLFNTVLEGFYLFSEFLDLGDHMWTNNMSKMISEKKCPIIFKIRLVKFQIFSFRETAQFVMDFNNFLVSKFMFRCLLIKIKKSLNFNKSFLFY